MASTKTTPTITLRSYLDMRRVTHPNWNFTGLGTGPTGWTGKYYVPPQEYDAFLTLHAAHIAEGRTSAMLERHAPLGGPILIDLDLHYKYVTDTELHRNFTDDNVRQFVADYCVALRDITGYADSLRAFVMMKPTPRRDPVANVIKDGIHIIMPDVTVPYKVQTAARDLVLSRGSVSIHFRDVTNPEKDVFDLSVIERNNWFLLGATKPDQPAYAITECLTIDGDGAVIPTEWTETPAELTHLFSLQYGRDRLTEGLTTAPVTAPSAPASVVSKRTADPVRRTARTATASVFSESASHICESEIENDARLEPLLQKLPAERWNDYGDWLKIGMALFNEGCSVDLWDRMSQSADTADKYTPGECARKWASFRRDCDRKVTAGTLKSWVSAEMGCDEIIDDLYACRRLVSLLGDELHREDDDIYVFNRLTGMWSKNETDLMAAVQRNRDVLIFKTVGDDGRPRTLNYGGNTRNIKNMLEHLKALLPNDHFISNNIESSLEYLLFADGIFHIPTQTFTDGFDKTKVFLSNIPRPFPRVRNAELEAEVNHRLFVAPFSNTDVGQYLKMRLARSIAGCYGDKKFLCALGEADSSKGTITNALRLAFGGYISEWDANCLKYNSHSSTDEAKRLSWLVSITNSRLAISNEIRMDNVPIEANLLKVLSGGGDVVTVRQNYKDEQKVKMRTSFMFMGNDMPDITPKGSAIETRVRMIRFAKRFVEKPTHPNELLADPTIKAKLATTEWMDAVFWVIVDAFSCTTEEPEEVKEETKAWIPPEAAKFREALEEAFVIDLADTSDDNYAPSRDIITHIKSCGLNISDTKIGVELGKLGLQKCQKKIGGKNIKIWVGLR